MMTKISRGEVWILGMTLLFVIVTVGWFLNQNSRQELTRIELTRQDALPEEQPSEDENPAPGLLEGERININTAAKGDLERLPGIGPARAQDIVTYRETVGPFSKPEDIMEVSGIGVKTYERIAAYITISEGGDTYAENPSGG